MFGAAPGTRSSAMPDNRPVQPTSALDVLMISSVPPRPTRAGEILLHRHLADRNQLASRVVPRPSWYKVPGLLRRLGWQEAPDRLDYLLRGRFWDGAVDRAIRVRRPDVLLTVAHGDACLAALRTARRLRLPLVTVFHDWWPDLVCLPSGLVRTVEAQFRDLHRASAVSLCVGEGMKEALGAHPEAEVLYPIPERVETGPRSDPSTMGGRFRTIYLGNLRDYGAMLAEALEASQGGSYQLQVRGSQPPWPESFTRRMRAAGCYLDFAPRHELDAWLATASAFLIVMEFDPVVRRRMETSFPSKIPECAQFGRPLVIWGPEWCSAVRWGREGRALCVTDRHPAALAATLRRLAGDPVLRARLTMASQVAAAGCFSPARLQAQFVRALRRAAGREG